MVKELNEIDLEKIIGGFDNDGKHYDVVCTKNNGKIKGANLADLEGTAAKDEVIATMTAKGWNCKATALD